uniref:Uncharacterized protein n=1 Tax=Avena sativa TaxID=4498 RepID=A0ACD5XYD4_AVESA
MVKKKSSWSQVVSGRPTNLFVAARNLQVQDLGAVIFGCTNSTIAECHARQLFGLPRSHLSYVQNIKEGLPLFLFNYDDRRLHGIYEAAGNGKYCPESNAWTYNGNEKTNYPAQVAMRVRTWCVPLEESKFRNAIIGNYYQKMPTAYVNQKPHFFRFELDHAQTRALMVMFTPSPSPIKFWMPPVAQPGGEHVREPTPAPAWVQKIEGNNELKSEPVLVPYADMVKQNKFETEGVGMEDVDVERNNELKTEKVFLSYAEMVKQNKFEVERVGTGDVDNEPNNEPKTEKVFLSYADMVKQNTFEVERVGTGDADNGHASSSKESSNGFDDLDCKETPPEWEDPALFNKEVEQQQQQQFGQEENELSFTLVLEKLKALSVQQLSSDPYANGAGTEGIDAYSCKDMHKIKSAFL